MYAVNKNAPKACTDNSMFLMEVQMYAGSKNVCKGYIIRCATFMI